MSSTTARPSPAAPTGERSAAGRLMVSPIRPRTYAVIGTRIAAMTFDDAVRYLLDAARERWRVSAHFCTTHTLVEAAQNERLRTALNAASLAAPDGMPLVWLGRRRGERVERVCGPDLMPAIIDRGRQDGARHFFYGGAPGVAERLAERLGERFPGMIVAGTHSPPFRTLTAEEDAAEVALIDRSCPDFVWVCLGSPKQDLWIADHRGALEATVLLAVGAAFDFHSGGLRRAPAWMQRAGMEWLFRLWAEPRRLARRYTVTNARFAYLLVRETLRARGVGTRAGRR